MLVFSSFVSSITAATTRLRNLTAHEDKQFFMLRKFLNQNRISPGLSARLTRYIDLVVHAQKKKTRHGNVELLTLLSSPLTVELMEELYKPQLCCHAFFELYSMKSPDAISHLCFTAVPV